MHLRFVNSLCTSTVLHGAALAAAVGVWALPTALSRGEQRPRDVHVQIAEAPRPEAPPPLPEELPPPLEELEADDALELVDVPLPPRPILEERFVRPELEDGPGLDRPFHHPRPQAPEPQPVTEPVTEPVAAEVPTPEADVPTGDPDPVVLRPVPVESPKPRYPRRAQERGIEGVVLLRLVVGTGGDVLLAEVDESSGSALLDRAALSTVRGWRFEPGREDGVPVEMELPWRLVFSLDA